MLKEISVSHWGIFLVPMSDHEALHAAPETMIKKDFERIRFRTFPTKEEIQKIVDVRV
jgi:hypothetical protein